MIIICMLYSLYLRYTVTQAALQDTGVYICTAYDGTTILGSRNASVTVTTVKCRSHNACNFAHNSLLYIHCSWTERRSDNCNCLVTIRWISSCIDFSNPSLFVVRICTIIITVTYMAHAQDIVLMCTYSLGYYSVLTMPTFGTRNLGRQMLYQVVELQLHMGI